MSVSLNPSEQGFVGHPEVRIRMLGRNAPLVPEEEVHVGPLVLQGGKMLVALPGRVSAGQRHGPRRHLEEDIGERGRQIFHDPKLTPHRIAR